MGKTLSKPWSREEEKPTTSGNAPKEEEAPPGELRMQMEDVEIETPLVDCFADKNDDIYMFPESETHQFVKKIAEHAEMIEDIVDAYPEIPVLSRDVLEQLNFRHVKERKIDNGEKGSDEDNEEDDPENAYGFEEDDNNSSEEEVDAEDEEGAVGNGVRKNADTPRKSNAVKNSVIENESFFAKETSKTTSPVLLKRTELLDLFRINKECIVIQQLVLDKIQDMEKTRQLEEQLRQQKNNHLTLQQPRDIDLFGELVSWTKRHQSNFTRYATMQNQFVVCVQAFLSEQLYFIKKNKELYNNLFLEKLENPTPQPPVSFFQQRLQTQQSSVLNMESGNPFDGNGNSNNISNNPLSHPVTEQVTSTPATTAFDYSPMEVELWKRKFIQTEGWAFNYIQALLKMRKDMADLYETILEKDVSLQNKPILQHSLNQMAEDYF